MKLIGLMPVRNEAWILGLSARAALMWCDELVLWLHSCTDNSAAIATQIQIENPGRVCIGQESGEWDEMRHRQTMLEAARELGATHIAIVDADEVLTGNLLLLRNALLLETMRPEKILQLPGYNLRGSINRYHANGIWGSRWFSVAFADQPVLHWGGDRFHHREPMGATLQGYRPIQQGNGGIMHLWGASERRLRAKHALYKITEELRWPGKRTINTEYSLWRSKEDATGFGNELWSFSHTPESWWKPYDHLMKYLDVDAEPWQESECRKLVAKHGRHRFKGLDLFGVA